MSTFGTMQMSPMAHNQTTGASGFTFTTPLPEVLALQMAITLVPRTIQVLLGITQMELKDTKWVMLMGW